MNLPNKISITRICMLPVLVAVFFIDAIPFNRLIATAIFIVAAMTDFLDGYYARKYNLVTTLGKFLDSIADKMLITVALILLIAAAPNKVFLLILCVCVIIIIVRDLAVNAIRMLAASAQVVIAADMGGKVKTTAQSLAIPVIMAAHQAGSVLGFDYFYLYCIGLGMLAVSVVLTITSGLHYLIKARQFLTG